MAGIRREKEAFERLIKERGVCVVVGLLYYSMTLWFTNKFFLVDALYLE